MKGKLMTPNVQYISDPQGQVTGVIVPIEIWRDLQSEQETAYLLRSPANREHLLRAIAQIERGETVTVELPEEVG